ncbi:MAG: chromosome segregation protein ScpA [Phenylobacterium sp. RIFCSPHIGHO2_01_FULL_69_31]|uniref:segregation and condensation protein A n=1 Tax=Phenylobacterium sp. RIFCSPHIGHO2_01_FULL_69_31 TaxID=1801944 RepID=UPI0008C02AF3|nr:ScpA family protein [Phenylobacterium sp. RIFCSPHIGHO2_01_FULL_69_31]OHB27854.1 MAG: chromosome segregation protein ScpA [Phenylobacterium sp. RIFCSPHIGHO2_01_FULL_69_31]
MSGGFQPSLDFAAASHAAEDGEALIVDLEGYEGPLHVLLALARTQKVDLLQLSILKLAEQYLAFVQEARRRRFSLAADYLVMAAWLAYLKSRLLLPKPEQPKAEEPPAEEMAQRLAFRLAKLEAMRNAAEKLMTGPQLGRDVFGRGDPEAIRIVPSGRLEGDLYGLMSAYIAQRQKEAQRSYKPQVPTAYPLEDARDRLRRLLPDLDRWTPLTGVAPMGTPTAGPSRASYVASTLSASLELVKEGALEARQLEAFADIYLRARKGGVAA